MSATAVSIRSASDGARAYRLLVLALVLSALMHIVVAVLLPAFRTPEKSDARPLEVAIVRPAVPEPMKVEVPPPPPPKPRRVEKPQPVRPEPPRTSAPARAPEPRLLALPEAAQSAPAPAFTVPQASVEPAPEAKPGSAPAAPPAPARETVAATPPNFNAAYLRNAPPRYPLMARRNGVEGTVRLKVLVTKDGRPAQVQLEQTSGSAVLDAAALEAVKGWHFVPARRGQEAVESWVVVPVVFKLENVS